MNDRQQENASRIALYLENRLSQEDKEAFRLALHEDDELRVQYVDALMNRAGTQTNADATTEPETETVNAEKSGGPVGDNLEREVRVMDDTNESGMTEPAEAERDVNIGEREDLPKEYHQVQARSFWGSGWMVGIVALLLIIAGLVIFIMISRGGIWNRTVAATAADSGNTNKGSEADSAAAALRNQQAEAGKRMDSAVSGASAGSKVAGGKMALADSIYARLYKPYMRGDDPVEARTYYENYRTGNYTAILVAGDSAVRITGARGLLIRDYMRLYVGLSYLATDDARNAVSELESVVFRTNPGDILYETAQWYLALAWLKRNDVEAAEAKNKSLGLAREIAHSYSRYREPAMELVRALE